MEKSNQATAKRIRAVRTWLDKASQSYEEESDTKGHIHLMMAEAEMQHIRRGQPSIVRRILWAMLVAGVAVTSIVGYAYYHYESQVVPVEVQTAPKEAVPTALEEPKPQPTEPTPIPEKVNDTTVTQSTQTPRESVSPPVREPSVTQEAPAISSEEIENAIRAGGKKLRQ